MKEYHQLWKENSESFPPELPQLVRAAPVERHHALMSPIERQREKHTVLKDKTSVRGLLRCLQRYLLTRQANDSMEGVIKSLKKLVDRRNEISREIDSKFFFECILLTMANYPSACLVQERCLHLLAAVRPKDMEPIATIYAVLTIMRSHPGHEQIQVLGCRILDFLFSKGISEEIFTSFNAEGGIETLSAAYQTFHLAQKPCWKIFNKVGKYAQEHLRIQPIARKPGCLTHLHAKLVSMRLTALFQNSASRP